MEDWALLVASATTLLGVGLGAWLAYFFGRRRTREERRAELLEKAMSATYQLQAARHYATGVPAEILDAPHQGDLERFNREIRAEGVRTFIDAASDCRMALAAVTPFCPEVKPYWDTFELPEDQADEVIEVLKGCSGSRTS